MGVDLGQINLNFLETVAGDPETARRQLERIEEYNRKHGATYQDGPIPVSLKPNFVSPRQQELMETASREVWGALETFVDLFLESPDLQDAWTVDDDELALYREDPGYEGAIQISRFDGFLEGDELSFLEFNCDSPGGIGYADVIHEAFIEAVHRQPKLGRGIELEQTARIGQLYRALLACYRSWRDGTDRSKEPYIVLADWPDVGSRPDIDITIERLAERGAHVDFADPRELELDGGELLHEGQRVDLLYKRVITDELLNEPKAEAIVEAYRAGTICMVNAPRSVIVGNKKIMAALRWDEVQEALPPRQRRAVEEFVPWTVELVDDTVEIEGLRVDLQELLRQNKGEFVLKPARGYGGQDVYLGSSTDEETWAKLVEEKSGEDWIAQRQVDIPDALYPRLDGDGVNFQLANVNVNPFVFGGQYAGAYTRISPEDVINVSAGGGLTPTVTATPPDVDQD
jgi:glutathionylspermidine synthase